MSSNELTLLSDHLADKDMYSVKTHENIANVLDEIIREIPNYSVIGIEGKWGSGKSSIINILQNKQNSEKKDDLHIFVFDSWAHESDDFKKIFLQELLQSFLSKNKKKLSRNFKKALKIQDKLTYKEKTTESKKKKKLNLLGKFLLLTLPFLAVGVAFFNKGVSIGNQQNFWIIEKDTDLITAILIFSAPLILISISFFMSCIVFIIEIFFENCLY